MQNAAQRLGLLGERIATRWLVQAGYVVVATRVRVGRRDIDVIARRGDTLAIVEVKTRQGEEFGGPVGAVGWQKQRQLVRATREWVSRGGTMPGYIRFDVVGVLVAAGRVRVCHVENAFQLPTS
jgi:putative endonuclease